MNLKRVLTALIGLPIVILIFVFGNKYLIDILVAIIACIAIREYFKCSSKEAKSISWIGYLLAISISLIHVVNIQTILIFLCIGFPAILLLLFLHIIITDMKINFKDITFSFFGIIYIISFIVFIPLIYGMEDSIMITLFNKSKVSDMYINKGINGKYLIWYVMLTAWGTDVFAYLAGKNFGKHKFSKVSPNKTIEGCVSGIIGAIVLTLVFTYVLNTYFGFNLSYSLFALMGGILSIIGQIGDFAASAIKRYFDVKDFSEIFPGHGGMIDRIDSVMFIAPFAFCLFTFLL